MSARLVVEPHGPDLLVRWQAADPALWRAILASFKAAMPACRYAPQSRGWVVPAWCRSTLMLWASRFSWDAQTWPRDGPARAPEGRTMSDVAAAYRSLHLLPSAPPELVTAAYRLAAQQHHPDHGGDVARMVELNRAVATIRAHGQRRSA